MTEEKTPQEREKLRIQQMQGIYRTGISAESLALDLKIAGFGYPLKSPEEVAAHNREMARLQLIVGKDEETLERLVNQFARLALNI